jgi:hypothetical protein
MERIPVKMLKYYGGVNAGEIAGYVPEVAERLIEQGFAEAYVPEDPVDGDDAPTSMTAAERKVLAKTLAKTGTATLPAQGEGA